MTINHHISDATLMAYASGSVSEAASLVLATHLSQCPECRARLEQMEEVGGMVFEADPGMAMSDGALNDIMALIDGEVMESPAKPTIKTKPHGELPFPLSDLLPDGFDEIDWKTMAPGVKSYTLIETPGTKSSAKLLKIAPGVTIPEHGHSDMELTLILQGSYSDEIGRFKKGDIADLDPDTEHQPIADTHEDCICLISTEQPLVFKQWVPRLMQYITGI